ncbi:MAG: hypothetical protein QM296_05075 [Bacillota bacterium]|nr:hypothetical protein [Bacillota bacterium]
MALFAFAKKNDRGKEESDSQRLTDWLDELLQQKIPEAVKAFSFNLYDDGNSQWSMELVGTRSFDPADTDWPCDEITDFGSRNRPFVWKRAQNWDRVLEEIISVLKTYLETGNHAAVLKSREGAAVGFVDGDLEILFIRQT